MCTRVQAKMLCENAPYNILVDVNAENQRKLLSDSATAPGPVTSLGLNNGRDEVRQRSLWTGFAAPSRRERVPVFAFHQRGVEGEEGGVLQHDSSADQPAGTNEECGKAGDNAIQRADIRCAFTAPI